MRQLLLLVAILAFLPLRGQRPDVNPMLWTLYNGRYDLSDEWFVNTEAHFRFVQGGPLSQILLRPQISYVHKKHFIFSFGYTYVHSYPYGAVPLPDDLGEHNLWEEVMINHPIGPFSVSHRIRLENRWVQQLEQVPGENNYRVRGYNFGNRLRYRLTLQYRLGDTPWSAVVYDELFFSMNRYLLPEGINQNWLFVGAKYTLNRRWSIQSGWQQQYLELSNGTTQQNPTWWTTVHFHLPPSN